MSKIILSKIKCDLWLWFVCTKFLIDLLIMSLKRNDFVLKINLLFRRYLRLNLKVWWRCFEKTTERFWSEQIYLRNLLFIPLRSSFIHYLLFNYLSLMSGFISRTISMFVVYLFWFNDLFLNSLQFVHHWVVSLKIKVRLKNSRDLIFFRFVELINVRNHRANYKIHKTTIYPYLSHWACNPTWTVSLIQSVFYMSDIYVSLSLCNHLCNHDKIDVSIISLLSDFYTHRNISDIKSPLSVGWKPLHLYIHRMDQQHLLSLALINSSFIPRSPVNYRISGLKALACRPSDTEINLKKVNYNL